MLQAYRFLSNFLRLYQAKKVTIFYNGCGELETGFIWSNLLQCYTTMLPRVKTLVVLYSETQVAWDWQVISSLLGHNWRAPAADANYTIYLCYNVRQWSNSSLIISCSHCVANTEWWPSTYMQSLCKDIWSCWCCVMSDCIITI